MHETGVVFECQGQPLVGVVSTPSVTSAVGVVMIVGGPQYRGGSHRQFVLLARFLANAGIAVLRFDYRGMGDSEGDVRTFEHIDADIAAAINCLLRQAPGISKVVLWGLCDAASAALFYGASDPRIAGMVLLNPWVRTEAGLAKAYLKHYYLQRLMEREFWLKILRGRFDFAGSMVSLLGKLRGSRAASPMSTGAAGKRTLALPERMCDCLARFSGRVLLVLSGDDLTAQEFQEVVRASPKWQKLLADPRVMQRVLPDANHTFSRREWRAEVENWTVEWVRSL